jgi:hypothetical protein
MKFHDVAISLDQPETGIEAVGDGVVSRLKKNE